MEFQVQSIYLIYIRLIVYIILNLVYLKEYVYYILLICSMIFLLPEPSLIFCMICDFVTLC